MRQVYYQNSCFFIAVNRLLLPESWYELALTVSERKPLVLSFNLVDCSTHGASVHSRRENIGPSTRVLPWFELRDIFAEEFLKYQAL